MLRKIGILLILLLISFQKSALDAIPTMVKLQINVSVGAIKISAPNVATMAIK